MAIETPRQVLVGRAAILSRLRRRAQMHRRHEVGAQVDGGRGVEIDQHPAAAAGEVAEERLSFERPLVRPEDAGDLVTARHLLERRRAHDRVQVRRQDVLQVRIVPPVDEHPALAVPGVDEIPPRPERMEDVSRDGAGVDETGRLPGEVVGDLPGAEPALGRSSEEESIARDVERQAQGQE